MNELNFASSRLASYVLYWSQGIMAGQSYNEIGGKKINFNDLSYFPMWMEGIFWVLDASIN